MKLTVITAVTVFLLCSVIAAERNGPNNILRHRRRSNETSGEIHTRRGTGERIINVRHENSNNARRRPGTFKVVDVSRTLRNYQRKFPAGVMTTKNPFTGRSQRSDIRASGSRSNSATKLYQKRRSLDLGIEPSQEIEQGAIFLEPVLNEEPKTDSLVYLLGQHFASDSKHQLGPSIGPLKFPGIGKTVYIRLMVPPDEETTSHVTVHLVNKAPVESSFGGIYETVEIAPHQKPKQLFTGKNPFTLHKAPIQSNPLISSSPENSRRSRFVDKSFHRLGFIPSKLEAMGLFRAQNHIKIPQEMPSHFGPTQFGNPRQYFAAPNHHQLPVVLRPADSLIDLPIYPPLSANGSNNKEEMQEPGKDKVNLSTDMEIIPDDAQQSASSKHTSVSRNHVDYQTPWQPIKVPLLPEPEVELNRRESPEPVFMEEVRAPDLSSGKILVAIESIWGKLNVAGYGPANLKVKNNTAGFGDAHGDDEHVVTATLDDPSRHATTSSRTNHPFPQDAVRSGERNTDNPDGGFRSTTSNPLLTGTSSKTLKKKKTK